MGRNRNKNLFWYGFFANIKKGFGGMILMGGGFFSLLGLFGSSNGLLFMGVCGVGIGLYLLATGSSERFDYQRQSGYIMHGGDR